MNGNPCTLGAPIPWGLIGFLLLVAVANSALNTVAILLLVRRLSRYGR